MEYLISEAAHAIRLSNAGEALNRSSSKYIEELEDDIVRLNTELSTSEQIIDMYRKNVK